jgi:hypothetical protein
VVELTGLLRTSVGGDQLENWPTGMRIFCRRERPSAGAQLSLFEQTDGWRYQLFATNTPGRQPDFLEARHRAHARVEDRVRCGKTTGLDHLPSHSMAINTAWCDTAMIATDLLRWFALLCLAPTMADAEPRTLRYRLLHTAARIVRGQRKRKIKIPRRGPGPTTCTPRSSAPSSSPRPDPRAARRTSPTRGTQPAFEHRGRECDRHRQATLDRAHAQHPERFTRRPRPPRLPEQAWINQPVLQPAQ